MVSRLYGHSSASGANLIEGEKCCIQSFEKKLVDEKVLTSAKAQQIWKDHFENVKKLADEVSQEAFPNPETLWDHTYFNNENANWRKF